MGVLSMDTPHNQPTAVADRSRLRMSTRLAWSASRASRSSSTGAAKISPREIDETLHPAVAEVVSFGVPHNVWGEEVEAAVVLRNGTGAREAELSAHCRDRLADFKC